METTVVGSFPSAPGRTRLMEAYRNNEDPFLESIEEAVNAQIDAGVELISDGQTRNDMVSAIVDKMSGIRKKGKHIIVGPIEHNRDIVKEDVCHAKDAMGGRAKLKGIVTGPHSLSMAVLDEYYHSKEKAAYAFAEALNEELLAIQDSGCADVVMVDEPFMSVSYPEYAKELVGIVFNNITLPRGIHICGDIRNIFSDVAEFNVDVLDHEFAVHPEQVDAIADTSFKQMLGYGCVRSDDPDVESVEIIAERIKRAVEIWGVNKLQIDPDCGLRNLPLESAVKKLENMTSARDLVQKGE